LGPLQARRAKCIHAQLYAMQGQRAFENIRRRYRSDHKFMQTVDQYIAEFEHLLDEVSRDDREQMVARTYLASETARSTACWRTQLGGSTSERLSHPLPSKLIKRATAEASWLKERREASAVSGERGAALRRSPEPNQICMFEQPIRLETQNGSHRLRHHAMILNSSCR